MVAIAIERGFSWKSLHWMRLSSDGTLFSTVLFGFVSYAVFPSQRVTNDFCLFSVM